MRELHWIDWGIIGSYVLFALVVGVQLTRPELLYSWQLFITVGGSAVVWIAVTLLTPPVDEPRLLEFLRRVRPGSPGWSRLARRHAIVQEPFVREAAPRWLAGCGVLFGVGFGLGSVLLGHLAVGSVLLGAGAALLVWVLTQLG